jgi:hypothetical protein
MKRLISIITCGIFLFVNTSLSVFADWTQSQKIKEPTPVASNQMGLYEESIAVDTYLVIGVQNYSSNQGTVYVYRDDDDDGLWDTDEGDVIQLEASDKANGDYFGHSVDTDGNYIIVGAYLDDDTNSGSGSAYVYEYDGAGWASTDWVEDKLIATDNDEDDHFGASVSIYDDSGTAYAGIGAPLDNEEDTNAGAAYTFKEVTDGNWGDEQKLTASDAASGDKLGLSTDIGLDTFVVGSPEEDGTEAGSAYVFTKSGATWGSTGNENGILTMDSQGGVDMLGSAVAINDAGDRIAVGAYKDGGGRGAVLTYNEPGGGWASATETAKIQPVGWEAGEKFGFSIDMNNEGTKLIGGAFERGQNNDGAAYVFSTSDGGATWVDDNDTEEEVANDTLMQSDDVGQLDNQGSAVAINDTYLFFSSPNDDDDQNNSGAVFYYSSVALGGGGGVPEFSTYVYVFTLMVAFSAINAQ